MTALFSLQSILPGLLVLAGTVAVAADPATVFSLAADFSMADNRADGTWSYRLEDFGNSPPSFPVLPSSNRDANALWGSDFPEPPAMWSEATGYWGIGKNISGKEQFSSRNGTRWAPGEVLFHPKAGASPSRLVVAWTAPANLVADVRYGFGRASRHGNGIGYEILGRFGGTDFPMVSLGNIGAGVTNELTGIAVARGDQLFFRFDTAGDPGGDISRAGIVVEAKPWGGERAIAMRPMGGSVAAGSDFSLGVSGAGEGPFQWSREGRPIAGATEARLRIHDAKPADAGVYSVRAGKDIVGTATLKVAPRPVVPERFPSPTPRQAFSETAAGQERELATNRLMLRFAASRKRLASDPYRPGYHFVSPESQLNDPNGLCFWRGRWHLFYQAYPPDEFPDPRDISKRRQHWGHAVSEDLVRWRDLPYAIYPGIERMCFSGSTVVETNQVVAFYPGIDAGQMVAIARDPLLLNWEKPAANPVIPGGGGDSCIWKEGDTYLGLIGRNLWTSTNLANWVARGEFYGGVEGSCPNFVPIGNKHIVLGFGHALGGNYVLGDYDAAARRFKPYEQGRFNHGTVSPGGVHAPSAAADGKGGVINILNINDAKPSPDWDQILSLPQSLTLGPDSKLRIAPVDAVASLRGNHRHVGRTALPANREIVLDTIGGNALELDVAIDPKTARWVRLDVLRSPDAEERTSVTFYNFDRKLSIWYDTKAVVTLDGTHSSRLPDVWVRPPESVALDRGARDWASAPTATTPGKPIRLRVFVDRSVVEVFVDGKQYLAMRVYPGRKDSTGVSIRAQGQAAVLESLDAWQMRSIWPKSGE